MHTLNFTTNPDIIRFRDYFTIAQGKNERTGKEYCRDIARFERFIAPTTLLEASSEQIQDWLYALLSEGKNKPQSVKRKYAALAAFFKYATKKKLLPRGNPCGEGAVDLPKCAKPLPKVMSEEDVQTLLNVPMQYRRYGQFLEPRNRAIMHILYASGLRRFEATALDLGDVDFERKRVRVRHGKGDKERYTFLNDKAIAALSAYLAVRPTRACAKSGLALFLTIAGERISPRELWAVFAKARRVAGFEGKCVPHTLRHCFATHIYRRSKDIRAVQKMLGHSSINTTERYTHVEDDELAEIYASSHPGARAA